MSAPWLARSSITRMRSPAYPVTPAAEQARARFAQGLLAPLQVLGVPPDAGGHGRGQPDAGGVAADYVLADPPEVGVPLAQVEAERAVELVGVLGGQGGGPLGAGAADDDLRPGRPARYRRAVLELVVLSGEAEPLPRLRVPESGEDRELLLKLVEALAERRERDAEVVVLTLVPGGADAELGAAAAHLVNGGDLDGELPGQPERGGVDERAEPYPFGLDGEAGERGPRVGRLVGRVVSVDAEVVVGAEEGVEAALVRGLSRAPGSARRWPRGAVRGGSAGASAVPFRTWSFRTGSCSAAGARVSRTRSEDRSRSWF